jgi:peptide chain release factor
MTDIILHLTSGKGPDECRWVLAQLVKAFVSEGARLGVTCEVLEAGEEALPASLLLSLSGDGAAAFAHERIGTILWIGNSLLRPFHKRRNWFVSVTIAPLVESVPELRDADIEFQTMRASGPGGQHVNKTDSAVRATHRPTGFVATAQEQRSQHANRKLAKLKLVMMLEARRLEGDVEARHVHWSDHQNLERGNPVRTYTGPHFKLKTVK